MQLLTGQEMTPAERFFWAVTAMPRVVVAVTLLVILAFTACVPMLSKDTTPDAFIAPGNPAIVYRNRVREIFRLEDPFVIAIVDRRPEGVFNRETLELVQTLSTALQKLPVIDPDRVTSLATERNIAGTAEGMEIEPFYALGAGDDPDPAAIRRAIADFPLYRGSLVSRDDAATLIVAETLPAAGDEESYAAIAEVVRVTPKPPGVEIHIIGEGAVSGYLGDYIDRDAKRLNPLAALVIAAMLFVAFRCVAGVLLPYIIVAATLAVAFGSMALAGVPFFVITNGLAANLIGISVAESIHVLSEYQHETADHPERSARERIVRVMARMLAPISLTSITTVTGFFSIWLGSEMPPMQAFGLFAAIGITVAWVCTIFTLPAAMMLLPLRQRPAAALPASGGNDLWARMMTAFGRGVLARPRLVLGCLLIVLATAGFGMSKVIVEEAAIENFERDEPIAVADRAMNQLFDGTNYLDIVVDSGETEGLFDPARLRRIEALQRFAETLPGVGGSTSIVDYVKQMHKAVNENAPQFYNIPDDADLIAQIFLLYSAAGDPKDLDDTVDYAYQRAHVRLRLRTSLYRNNRRVVEDVERYLANNFNGTGMTAHLSGRVYVNHHWLETIAVGHNRSVLLSLIPDWFMCAFLFRSFAAGALCLVPVVLSILIIYAVMGFGGIWLGVGTSMFAAIAIGLGVDFAIHTLHRMREMIASGTGRFDERILPMFRLTGRALFFNAAAVSLGFLVLASSSVPPLARFGGLVALAMTVSFFAAVAVLPAVAKIFRPAFLFGPGRRSESTKAAGPLRSLLPAAAMSAALTAGALPAHAEDLPSATAVMQNVVARDEGSQVTRALRMETTDRGGTSRVRETISHQRFYGSDKRTILFFLDPANVKGTGFLTYDYAAADREDDQWLYLPALRKVRRISAADRGDYFLGTDFTYEDMKKENKLAIEDYTFKTLRRVDVDGVSTIAVEGTPVNDKTAAELGYGRVVWHVDPEVWISRLTEIWDINGNPLKTVRNLDIRLVDGIATVHRIEVENHKTGHRTVFAFTGVDYRTPIPDRVFDTRTLERGL